MGRKKRFQIEYFESELKKSEIVFAHDEVEAETEFKRIHAAEPELILFHVERFLRVAA